MVSSSPTAGASTRPSPIPDVQTTVITPAPPVRNTVSVEDLRAGDCVEIQQTEPDLNNADTQLIKIFPVHCEIRDGVFRVDLISSTNPCTDEYLTNRQGTVFACISRFKGLTPTVYVFQTTQFRGIGAMDWRAQ
jgi:hypothetical protein